MKKEKIAEFYGCGKKCEHHRPISDIVVPLHLVDRLLVEIYEGFCKKNSITNSELDVLLTVAHYETPLSPTELYEGMLFSSGGMTKILKKLEASGFIRRVPSEKDKRSTLVEITDSGKEIATKTLDEILTKEEEIFSCLDDNEQAVMKRGFEKVIKKLIS